MEPLCSLTKQQLEIRLKGWLLDNEYISKWEIEHDVLTLHIEAREPAHNDDEEDLPPDTDAGL